MKRALLSVAWLVTMAGVGLFGGWQVALAQCECTEACAGNPETDGDPLGDIDSRECMYSESCSCSDGEGVPGWCRNEHCKVCHGNSSQAWRCSGNEEACMNPNRVLCLNICS